MILPSLGPIQTLIQAHLDDERIAVSPHGRNRFLPLWIEDVGRRSQGVKQARGHSKAFEPHSGRVSFIAHAGTGGSSSHERGKRLQSRRVVVYPCQWPAQPRYLPTRDGAVETALCLQGSLLGRRCRSLARWPRDDEALEREVLGRMMECVSDKKLLDQHSLPCSVTAMSEYCAAAG